MTETRIIAKYSGNLDSKADARAKRIFEVYRGSPRGSLYDFSGHREIEYAVDPKLIPILIRQLKQAGFEVEERK